MDELRDCAGCSGIVYRQTDSAKIIPMECTRAMVPNCFERASGYSDNRCMGMAPDGDDEPIEKCKQCPFCTINDRRHSPKPEALTLSGKTVKQITITGSEDEVLAVITADKIIEKNGVSVAVDWD